MTPIKDAIKSIVDKHTPVGVVKSAIGLGKDMWAAQKSKMGQKKAFSGLVDKLSKRKYEQEGWGQKGSGKVPSFFRGENQTSKDIREEVKNRYKNLQ
jgi:hypothetical protein